MSDKNNDNSFQMGLFGLTIGFLAGAAAVILSDPDKREKAAEILDKTKTNTLNTVNKLAETVKEKTDQIQSQITEAVANAEDTVNSQIDKIENKEV
jgi:gas vesicle protein